MEILGPLKTLVPDLNCQKRLVQSILSSIAILVLKLSSLAALGLAMAFVSILHPQTMFHIVHIFLNLSRSLRFSAIGRMTLTLQMPH